MEGIPGNSRSGPRFDAIDPMLEDVEEMGFDLALPLLALDPTCPVGETQGHSRTGLSECL